MRIEVGQDGLGYWAWFIKDQHDHVVASDDNYREAGLALEAALLKRRNIAERDRGW